MTAPKSLDLGTTDAADATVLTVPELPTVKKATPVGRLYSSGRHRVLVTLQPEHQLKATAAKHAGTYKGDVDVNGAAAGGVTTVTMHARDGWLWPPLVVLLGGIAVGFLIEWWLTRLRPRSLLDRRLGRLMDGAEMRRTRVDRTMQRLFARGRPKEILKIPAARAWRVPQVASSEAENGVRYHLNRAGNELVMRLQNARTDPERALFGPDGDAYKTLLADAETYAALIGDLREAAHIIRSDFERLREHGPVALRDWFDHECRGWIIGDKHGLDTRRDSAQALKSAAEHFAEYSRRLTLAAHKAPGESELAKKIEAHRRLLDATFRGDDGQVVWWDDALPKLEAGLDGATTPSASAEPVAEGARLKLETAPTLLDNKDASMPEPPRPDADAPAAEPEPPWRAPRGVFRAGDFGAMEALIGFINLVIVAASGLSAVYFANSTFGSAADYLTLALWGSTATAGLALLRRLVPGALTTRQPSGGG